MMRLIKLINRDDKDNEDNKNDGSLSTTVTMSRQGHSHENELKNDILNRNFIDLYSKHLLHL